MEQREALTTHARADTERSRRPPRWVVVSGLVLYCSVFWMLIWAAGTFGVDMVRAASALGH